MSGPTLPLASAIATIDGEIRDQGRQLHRAECDRHLDRVLKIRYAMQVLRHVRHEIYQTAGVDEAYEQEPRARRRGETG